MATWQSAVPAGEVVEGLPVLVTINGIDICVLHHGDRYYAIDDLCTHAEASLSEGEQRGRILECPRHGGQFDIHTGEAVHYPAFAPVTTYPVKVDHGMIYIEVE
jgi:nitrite reductase/ring-hydroxylating ferredoxin subunit